MENTQEQISVTFSGNLKKQIEEKANEAGMSFEEYVKARMAIALNDIED